MEIRLLESFAIAAELQSFTRAADSLGVTQAAVSQHIAALEKELKVSLFERTGRAVVLTDAGKTLYSYARRILDLAKAAQDEITQTAKVVHGTLKLGASSVPSEWLLPELLVEFRKLYPTIRESVIVSDSSDTIEAVESGSIEIGLVGLPAERIHLRVIFWSCLNSIWIDCWSLGRTQSSCCIWPRRRSNQKSSRACVLGNTVVSVSTNRCFFRQAIKLVSSV